VHGWLGVHMAKIVFGLIFKRHSLGGSSIACLQVSTKCTVAFAYAGRATRWALPSFLVSFCSNRPIFHCADFDRTINGDYFMSNL